MGGHGGQMRDMDGDETDGKDELICPVDYNKPGGGCITDDWLRESFTKSAKLKNSQTMVVFDCCHSGTLLDLPYEYNSSTNCRTIKWIEKGVPKPEDPFVLYLSACQD